MSWNEIIGHQAALDRFRRSVDRGRLASTYLFVGPEGIGKRTFALKLAEAMLCEANQNGDALEPCGHCPGCVQVHKRTHPDLILVSKPADKSQLPVELFIGRKEHRLREGLVHDIGLKPFRGGYRIAIIDDADFFNAESANSLLKTLEEPPPNSLLILLGTSEQRQLHTIVSRSQLVRFQPLATEDVAQVLQRPDVLPAEQVPAETDLQTLASMSQGSVARALTLTDPEVIEIRRQLYEALATGNPHAGQFTKVLTSFAESAGKEGYRKRPRLTLIGDLTIEYFQQVAVQLIGVTDDCPDQALVEAAGRLVNRLSVDPLEAAERVGRCIDRTSEMKYHVAANIGFPNLIDSWLIDIGRLLRGEVVTTGEILTGVV